LIQFGTDVWKWITDAGTWQRFHDGVATRWTAFSAWAGGVWTTVQPKLIQFGADVRKWIDENAPELSKWLVNFEAFGTGVAAGWKKSLPDAEKRLSEFADSVESSTNRILTAWQRVFGDGTSPGLTADALGEWIGMLAGDAVQGTLEWFSLQLEALSHRLNQLAYSWQALNAAMGGDWGAAMEFMNSATVAGMLANDSAYAGGAIQDAIIDANEAAQNSIDNRSETINVYVNGQAASGDVRAFARLGVTEALRARGAQ
jgi:hypothetical protein